jgi:hypothetical protein
MIEKSTRIHAVAPSNLFCKNLNKKQKCSFCTKSASITASKYVTQLEVKSWMILKSIYCRNGSYPENWVLRKLGFIIACGLSKKPPHTHKI